MRLISGTILGVLSLTGMIACGANEGANDLGSTSEATTASGKAKEGDACLLAPVYRKDKCAKNLTCAATGNATKGVCVSPHAESDSCEPAYGNVDCATGLTCTALPNGGGFCKGSGQFRCRVSNGGLDCAAGRTCVPTAPNRDEGTCKASGGEGTACDPDVVTNVCGSGLECVETPNGGGICSSATNGGVGAPCGLGSATGYCQSPYLCAVAPEARGQFYSSTSTPFRCQYPQPYGGTCYGVFDGRNVDGANACHGDLTSTTRDAGCAPKHPESAAADTIVEGVCTKPVFDLNAHCGDYGVDDCADHYVSGSSYERMRCLNGTCVKDGRGAQESCDKGVSPSGQTADTCAYSWYLNRKWVCTNGRCG